MSSKRTQTINKICDNVITALLFLLVVGTPLLFTSLTRSVFEVNKLLLLRIVTILVLCVWFFRYLVNENDTSSKNNTTPQKKYNFLGLTWEKVGLELPVLLWLGANILSTVFSQNIKISLIGAYDRWEGIFTIINYMVLLYIFAKQIRSKKQFLFILWGILIPAGLSAIYGIYQSLGWDFMHWSVDPTKRVFACINNPVHFCAYVAMVVPIGLSWLLYLSEKSNNLELNVIPNIPLTEKIKSVHHIIPLLLGLFCLNTNWSAFFGLFVDYYPETSFLGIFFGRVNFTASLILTVIWIVSLTTQELIPKKQSLLRWSGVLASILIIYYATPVQFSKETWTSILLISAFYYIFASLPNWHIVSKRAIFVVTTLIYYAQYLSYSRATWIGFIGAMTVYYLTISGLFNDKNEKTFVKDFIITGLGIGVLYIYDIFKIYKKGIEYQVPLLAILIAFAAFMFIQSYRKEQKEDTNYAISFIPNHDKWSAILLSVGMFFTFIFDFSKFPLYVQIPLYAALIITYIKFCMTSTTPSVKSYASKLTILFLFVRVQFTGVSITSMVLYFTLIIGFYFLILKGQENFGFEKKYWLFVFTIIFGLIFIIPMLPNHIQSITNIKVNNLLATKNVANRLSGFERDGVNGSARTSMWKSSVPWTKDYIFIGSGLDTIKYMYPIYRRPEYGILEGGHNFTPDRLHNEYLNTLASKGFLGFGTYYFGVILFWLILSLKGYFKFKDNPNKILLMGLISGALIYLGQVFFNFGVVATLVLFYVEMGLCIALIHHPGFKETHEK